MYHTKLSNQSCFELLAVNNSRTYIKSHVLMQRKCQPEADKSHFLVAIEQRHLQDVPMFSILTAMAIPFHMSHE